MVQRHNSGYRTAVVQMSGQLLDHLFASCQSFFVVLVRAQWQRSPAVELHVDGEQTALKHKSVFFSPLG